MNVYWDSDHELVELPAELTSVLGEVWTVEAIAVNSAGGRAGKLCCVNESGARDLSPTVFGCYIADEPKQVAA